MRIYHYTTIETLALVLKNRTIRFNRLDNVDDLEEGDITSAGIKLGRYAFVSCWTETDEESIPLWKMYTNGCSGVRISFEYEPFEDYIIKSNSELKVEDDVTIKKLPLSELMNSKYFILPNFSEGFFYRKMEYVDDIFKRIGNIVTSDGTSTNIAFGEIGRYKNKRWAFQEESRFVIMAFPKKSPISYYSPEYATEFMFLLANNIEPPFNYYDLALKVSSFDNLEVTLSPLANESQEIITQGLLNNFAPKAVLKNSSLSKLTKLK